jgi:transcriptional regulator of acetoin/glycerol metabolism
MGVGGDFKSGFDEIFHGKIAELSQKRSRKILRVSEEVALICEGYDWPGEEFELARVLDSTIRKCHGVELQLQHLPRRFLNRVRNKVH